LKKNTYLFFRLQKAIFQKPSITEEASVIGFILLIFSLFGEYICSAKTTKNEDELHRSFVYDCTCESKFFLGCTIAEPDNITKK